VENALWGYESSSRRKAISTPPERSPSPETSTQNYQPGATRISVTGGDRAPLADTCLAPAPNTTRSIFRRHRYGITALGGHRPVPTTARRPHTQMPTSSTSKKRTAKTRTMKAGMASDSKLPDPGRDRSNGHDVSIEGDRHQAGSGLPGEPSAGALWSGRPVRRQGQMTGGAPQTASATLHW
jgi:hypothetical protein